MKRKTLLKILVALLIICVLVFAGILINEFVGEEVSESNVKIENSYYMDVPQDNSVEEGFSGVEFYGGACDGSC
jgi:hypothetical protein